MEHITEKNHTTNTTQPLNMAQRAADELTKHMGSWHFILGFLSFLVIWIILNALALLGHIWDPYPFILLNLALSCLAAIQAPIILMSQNRQSERDREMAQYDYLVNKKAEREIRELRAHVLELKELVKQLENKK